MTKNMKASEAQMILQEYNDLGGPIRREDALRALKTVANPKVRLPEIPEELNGIVFRHNDGRIGAVLRPEITQDQIKILFLTLLSRIDEEGLTLKGM